jgi:prepilin-type N-terminal cleavage/methylation domain-containing protein
MRLRALLGSRSGFTILELLASLGIMALVSGVAVSTLGSTLRPAYSADGSSRELAVNMKLIRSMSISRGVHYRVTVVSTKRYRVDRLVDTNADDAAETWEVEGGRSRTVDLPGGITFATASVGQVVEFDTRGMAVQDAATVSISLVGGGATRRVEVWRSGQVYELIG